MNTHTSHKAYLNCTHIYIHLTCMRTHPIHIQAQYTHTHTSCKSYLHLTHLYTHVTHTHTSRTHTGSIGALHIRGPSPTNTDAHERSPMSATQHQRSPMSATQHERSPMSATQLPYKGVSLLAASPHLLAANPPSPVLLSYVLQHSATHYNTQQHTEHTATRCHMRNNFLAASPHLLAVVSPSSVLLANVLQRTALHCNTHTATHCSPLQHTAMHCNTLQHPATHCNSFLAASPRRLAAIPPNTVLLTNVLNALQGTATHYNTLQHTATHCNTL